MFDCVSWVVVQVIFSLKCQKHSSSIWLACVRFRAARTLNCKEMACLCGLIFCVITICDWPFPKMACNFPAQIIFQKNYILRFCRERNAHLLKCKFEFLEKKHQIFILIYKVAINCYFSGETSLKMTGFGI